MKCTLRKVEQGVVATRPTESTNPNGLGYYYDKYLGCVSNAHHPVGCKVDFEIIIASTFGVGKEFKWERKGLIQNVNNLHDRFIEQVKDKQYDYTETETQIIIKL